MINLPITVYPCGEKVPISYSKRNSLSVIQNMMKFINCIIQDLLKSQWKDNLDHGELVFVYNLKELF